MIEIMRKYLVRVSTHSLQAKTPKKAENVCKTMLELEQTGTQKQHVEKRNLLQNAKLQEHWLSWLALQLSGLS